MRQEILCSGEHEFVEKLKETILSGIPKQQIRVFTPVPVPEAEHIIGRPYTKVRWYAVAGALTGCATGLSLTCYTVLRFPLMTSAKPLISWLPFLIISFELTILFGAISSLLGFLLLSRLPYVPWIVRPLDYGNQFAIIIDDEQ